LDNVLTKENFKCDFCHIILTFVFLKIYTKIVKINIFVVSNPYFIITFINNVGQGFILAYYL